MIKENLKFNKIMNLVNEKNMRKTWKLLVQLCLDFIEFGWKKTKTKKYLKMRWYDEKKTLITDKLNLWY